MLTNNIEDAREAWVLRAGAELWKVVIAEAADPARDTQKALSACPGPRLTAPVACAAVPRKSQRRNVHVCPLNAMVPPRPKYWRCVFGDKDAAWTGTKTGEHSGAKHCLPAPTELDLLETGSHPLDCR